MLITAAVVLGLLALYFGPHAIRVLGERRLQRLCSEQRALVLTFDDGQGESATAKIDPSPSASMSFCASQMSPWLPR